MSDIRWDLAKSTNLKKQRGVSFEEIIQAKLVTIKEHPSRAHQNILLFEYRNYIWVVTYVFRDNEIFLKTLFPSRKYTKLWRRGELQ